MKIILSFFIFILLHILFYRIFKKDINFFLLFFLPIIFFLNVFEFFDLEILIVLILLILSNIVFFKGVKNLGPSLLIINYIVLNKPKKIPLLFKNEMPLQKRLSMNIENKFIIRKNNYFILSQKSKIICYLYFSIIALFNLN
tara:strand:+ start:2875 stop:3300 length:426 start_codon:yes stop_codon:yes gene_type:complete